MQEIIQNITFPQNDMLEEHAGLYYRGTKGVLLKDDERKYLVLPAYEQTEFNTYLNGCSIEKWKKYTNLEKLKLSLTAEGQFVLKLYAYSLRSTTSERKLLVEKRFELTEKTNIEMDIPDIEEQMIGFTLDTLSPVTLWGAVLGNFSGCQRSESDHFHNHL